MIKGLSIIAAIAMLMLTADIRAQAVTVDDPTGGVAPEAIYCPSTGGCFTSLKAAEDAMMAATPLLGQYLRYSWTSQQERGGIPLLQCGEAASHCSSIHEDMASTASLVFWLSPRQRRFVVFYVGCAINPFLFI